MISLPEIPKSYLPMTFLSSYDVLVSSRRWRHHHERALVFILLIYFLFQKLPLSLKLRLQCRSPPTIDQLYNHGTTAFPKRSETKNPRMEHNNFWAWTKVSGAVNKFPGKQISFRGWTKRLWERSKYLWGSSRISAHAYNFFGQPGKFSGTTIIYLGHLKI